MQTKVKRPIRLIVSLAIVAVAVACDHKSAAAPDVGPTPVFDTTPDFTGTWIGISRVIFCEDAAGGCASYPAGHERYLDFRLTQRGDEVTGNLSPTKGGPLSLPAVFWISGRTVSGQFTFQPMEVAGASGGLISYSGEVALAAVYPTQMLGRMSERTTATGEPLVILWEIRTTRQ